MKEIAAALVKAQKAFGPALKTSANPAFRSKYAKLENCIDAVIDALNDNGIMLMQNTHEHPNGIIVETLFLHESGEVVSNGKLYVPAAKHDPQGFGGALTYARRYSLMAACGIAPEDDDGNAAVAALQEARKVAAEAARPVKAAPAKVEDKAPVKIEGKDTPWQLKIVAKPDGNHNEWSQLVIDSTLLQFAQVKSKKDVTDIYKTNKNIYDEVKSGSPGMYETLMSEFSKVKAKYEEPA